MSLLQVMSKLFLAVVMLSVTVAGCERRSPESSGSSTSGTSSSGSGTMNKSTAPSGSGSTSK